MMIDIFSHIIQIIVFAAGTNALLRIHGALDMKHLEMRITGAQEFGLELIHSRIGKE
jgi:hypothetical protein